MTISESWNPTGARSEETHLLRRTLFANATFSILTGSIVAIIGGTLLTELGVPEIVPAEISGLMLIFFGLFVGWSAMRIVMPVATIWLIIGLDAGWVLGSAMLSVFLSLPPIGNTIVLVIASAVLIFAILQITGLRRIR